MEWGFGLRGVGCVGGVVGCEFLVGWCEFLVGCEFGVRIFGGVVGWVANFWWAANLGGGANFWWGGGLRFDNTFFDAKL